MSVQSIVLYAPRLYAEETYSTNQDPESLTASLSDSTTLTDTDFKFVQDAILIIDAAIATNGIKPLAESMSMTEAALISALKILTDSLLVADASILIQQIKGLSEFIRVKDWVELNLQRADIWSVSPAFGVTPSQIHLYGPGVYYAVDYYGANPSVNWLLTTINATTWRNNESLNQGLTLYTESLYTQRLFGTTAVAGWTKPNSTAQQAWTNENGESHN